MIDPPQPRCAPGLVPGHADGRLVAPSAERNIQAIADTLAPFLRDRHGLALEIGSGTGQHSVALASAFPALDWQPSDPFDAHLDSIRAWVAHSGLPNLRAPLWLDAAEDWPRFEPLAGVISANVIHITPWAVAQGIVRGAATALDAGGVLVFYGPFIEGGRHVGENNAGFDATLRAEDPAWGIRDIDDVTALAAGHGFAAPQVIEMPASNRVVVFHQP